MLYYQILNRYPQTGGQGYVQTIAYPWPAQDILSGHRASTHTGVNQVPK
jgi:hypothetical protein